MGKKQMGSEMGTRVISGSYEDFGGVDTSMHTTSSCLVVPGACSKGFVA